MISFNKIKDHFLDSGYQVKIVPPSVMMRYTGQPGHFLGLVMHESETILIARGLSIEEAKKTLIHEMIHIYNELVSEDRVEKNTLEIFSKLNPDDSFFLGMMLEDNVDNYTEADVRAALAKRGVITGAKGRQGKFLVRDTMSGSRFEAGMTWLRSYLKELLDLPE